MIAKLVTHAPTREAAIDAQAEALDAFVVDGIRHNIPFLSALMAHQRWRSGKLSTGFIAEEFSDGFHAQAPQGDDAKLLAAVAAAIDHVLGERKRNISGQMNGRTVTRESRRAVRLGDQEIGLKIWRDGDGDEVLVAFDHGDPGAPYILGSAWKGGDPLWSGTVNGTPVKVQVRPILNGFALSHRGIETTAYVYTEREAAYT